LFWCFLRDRAEIILVSPLKKIAQVVMMVEDNMYASSP